MILSQKLFLKSRDLTIMTPLVLAQDVEIDLMVAQMSQYF